MAISKRTLFLIELSAALFGAASVSAQRKPALAPMFPVVAKLTIPDTKLLPGVPFEMWIDVEYTRRVRSPLGC
jgi:hypothetical protein